MMIAPTASTVPPLGPDLENFLPAQRETLLRGLAANSRPRPAPPTKTSATWKSNSCAAATNCSGRCSKRPPPLLCPHCQNQLPRLTQGHGTIVQTRWGNIRVERARGYGQRCKKWRFPADALLGLPEEGTQSPGVQEIAALVVSKMPAPEAEQVVHRLTGVPISAGTLARAATNKTATCNSNCRWTPSPWSSNWTPGTSASATNTGDRKSVV